MIKRSFSRENVDIGVTIDARDKIVQGRVENISMGGLYATTGRRPSIKEHDIVDLSIPLPVGARNNCFVVTGMATRVNDSGVAFKFLETDMETLRSLFYLVSRSSKGSQEPAHLP